jgi:hypothetical protein
LNDKDIESGFTALKKVGIGDRAFIGCDEFAHVEFRHVSLCISLE